jgi:hypothetical protein
MAGTLAAIMLPDFLMVRQQDLDAALEGDTPPLSLWRSSAASKSGLKKPEYVFLYWISKSFFRPFGYCV